MWKAVAGSGGKMPTPRLMQGVERLGATLTEAELFARFMREFSAMRQAPSSSMPWVNP